MSARRIDAKRNAGLEPFKRAFLQLAVDAVSQAAAELSGEGVKVPPAYLPVAVAQCLLESAWGTSRLATLGRNLFGVKARDGEPGVDLLTTEYHRVGDQQVPVRVPQRFRRYEHFAAAFKDHARLLCTRKGGPNGQLLYHAALGHPDDPCAFADALTGLYATDPLYGSKLRDVMRSRGLFGTFGFLPPA